MRNNNNEQNELLVNLVKSYQREILNYLDLKNSDDKNKSKEKINETHGLIVGILDEFD